MWFRENTPTVENRVEKRRLRLLRKPEECTSIILSKLLYTCIVESTPRNPIMIKGVNLYTVWSSNNVDDTTMVTTISGAGNYSERMML